MKRFNAFRLKVAFFFLSLTALTLAPSGAKGDVPRLINFQGILKNGSGNPVVGSNSVTFKIYTAPAGGTVLWTETQTITTDSAGFSTPFWELPALCRIRFFRTR